MHVNSGLTGADTFDSQSLDYGIVIEGSIVMVLDDGEEHVLNRGDLAVQRATMRMYS
jgi:hypothetical protein